jgi:hypothetical protein
MTAHLILAGLAIVAIAVLVVLVSPTRQCIRCKGERVTRHRLTKRLMGCPRCKGTGRHYRRGATLVHRFAWTIRPELRRDKED